jgi:hypothetical protein
MEFSDLFANAMSELLIENMTMRRLLKEHDNLAGPLRRAKSDPTIKKIAESYVAPLRTAIPDEVELEGIFQNIVNNPPSTIGLA